MHNEDHCKSEKMIRGEMAAALFSMYIHTSLVDAGINGRLEAPDAAYLGGVAVVRS